MSNSGNSATLNNHHVQIATRRVWIAASCSLLPDRDSQSYHQHQHHQDHLNYLTPDPRQSPILSMLRHQTRYQLEVAVQAVKSPVFL